MSEGQDERLDTDEEPDVEGHRLEPGRAEAGRAEAGRAEAGRAEAGRMEGEPERMAP